MSKKKILAWVLMITMIFTNMSWPSGIFTFTTAEASSTTVTEATELTPEVTSNKGDQNYTASSSPIYSYLVSVDSGLMRVEYNGSDVVVEYYDSNYTLTAKKYVTVELTYFGGFYAGEDAYYLVFGEYNEDEDDDFEVIRVVKYSTSWVRQGQASLYGTNTVLPFSSGSLRMDEYNGYLYIRTSHVMYESSDGYNHQANLTMVVDENSMSVIHTNSDVSNVSTGYVSHSFNQFIMVDDDGYIVAADHGDAYPRSAVIFKYTTKAGLSTVSTANNYVEVFEFAAAISALYETATSASIGGLEYSSSSYLLVGNSIDQEEDVSSQSAKNIFVTVTSRNDFSSSGTSVKWITDYDKYGDVTTSTPQLVKINEDSFLLLWTVKYIDSDVGYSRQYKLNYVFLDGEGNTTSEIYEVDGQLSDCQPILVDDKVVWYVTGDINSYNSSTSPYFYSIDLNGNYTAPETLDTPEFSTEPSSGGLDVTWDEVDGAEGYTIYLAFATNTVSTYTVEGADTTSYTIKYPNNGEKFYIWMEAYAGDTKSLVSEKTMIYYFRASLTKDADSITVSWGDIDDATSYEVYRKTTGSYVKVSSTTDTSWEDTNLISGSKYTYQVVAKIDGTDDVYTYEVSAGYLDAPVLLSVENVSGGMNITWETVEGAEEYDIVCNNILRYAIASDDDTQSYKFSGTSGTLYTVTVSAFMSSALSERSNAITYMYLACPTVTLTINDDDITLSWSAITGADGYKIYRKVEDGSYSLVDTTTDTSWTDTDVSTSTLYTYQVYAYSGDYISAGSTEKTGEIKAAVTYLLGDVNEDGLIDSQDAMMVLRYDSMLITLDEAQLLAGDVNFDGVVDSSDAVQILRYDALLISSFE